MPPIRVRRALCSRLGVEESGVNARAGYHEAIDRAGDLGRFAARSLADLWRNRPQYQHGRLVARDINADFEARRTFGERLADRIAATMGSWRFIIIQSRLLLGWIGLNVLAIAQHWDPYPFILLNLALSFQAAYAAPIIMMSQNRQAIKDRLAAENDFEVNRRAEDEVRAILQHLEYQDNLILQIVHRLDSEMPDGRAGVSSGDDAGCEHRAPPAAGR
jgi:uncharacterized membrane protein